MALGGALSRLSDDAGKPLFLIKGGVSLEMRLRLRARATKDFDTTFRGQRNDALAAIEGVRCAVRGVCLPDGG